MGGWVWRGGVIEHVEGTETQGTARSQSGDVWPDSGDDGHLPRPSGTATGGAEEDERGTAEGRTRQSGEHGAVRVLHPRDRGGAVRERVGESAEPGVCGRPFIVRRGNGSQRGRRDRVVRGRGWSRGRIVPEHHEHAAVVEDP